LSQISAPVKDMIERSEVSCAKYNPPREMVFFAFARALSNNAMM